MMFLRVRMRFLVKGGGGSREGRVRAGRGGAKAGRRPAEERAGAGPEEGAGGGKTKS